MSANSHAPNPRGVLCNAGAGAAAGTSICLVSEKIEEKEKKKKNTIQSLTFFIYEKFGFVVLIYLFHFLAQGLLPLHLCVL